MLRTQCSVFSAQDSILGAQSFDVMVNLIFLVVFRCAWLFCSISSVLILLSDINCLYTPQHQIIIIIMSDTVSPVELRKPKILVDTIFFNDSDIFDGV